MSDPEDTQAAQTARVGSNSRGGRALRDDDRGRPWNRRDFVPADDPGWVRCTVKSHEDFPRHIFRLFLLLDIQFRWLLTRGTLARALVTSAELAIDDARGDGEAKQIDLGPREQKCREALGGCARVPVAAGTRCSGCAPSRCSVIAQYSVIAQRGVGFFAHT